MKNKFEIGLVTDIKAFHYEDMRYEERVLLDVIPKSLSLNCPHCQAYAVMRIDSAIHRFEVDSKDGISFRNAETLAFDFICSCPNCNNIVFVQAQTQASVVHPELELTREEMDGLFTEKIISIYPTRKNVDIPPDVPDKYASSFREAVMILELSPTASAALSRRILQDILRDEFGIQHRNLVNEIDAFIELPGIPSYLTDAVDAIRNIGNLAAHPIKNTNTGEVVAVEPGEAEWLIEVLYSLFDFKFIQPKKLQERRNRLNSKLQEMGKPPMK